MVRLQAFLSQRGEGLLGKISGCQDFTSGRLAIDKLAMALQTTRLKQYEHVTTLQDIVPNRNDHR